MSKLRTLMFTTAAAITATTGAYAADPAPSFNAATILDGEPGKISYAGITVYGVADVNLTYLTHGANISKSSTTVANYIIAANSNKSRFLYAANGLSTSFIGIKGDQKLSNFFGIAEAKDWSVGFKGEIGFDPVTGEVLNGIKSVATSNGLPLRNQVQVADSSRAGQLFNGEAYAKIAHVSYGELRYGRNNTLLADQIGAYDPVGGNAFSLLNNSGTVGGGLGATTDLRWNNSLKYLNTVGPVRYAAQYRFQGGGQGGEDYGFSGGIDGWGFAKGFHLDGSWGVVTTGVAESGISVGDCATLVTGGAGCNGLNVINGTISKNTAFAITARYEINKLTILGGWENIDSANGATSLNGSNVQGEFSLSPLAGGQNYYRFQTDRYLNIVWIGGRYKWDEKTSLSAQYVHEEQNSYRTGTTGSLAGGLVNTTVGNGTRCSAGNNTTPATSTGNNVGGITTVASNCHGSADFISGVYDYQLTKRIDLYAGIQWSQFSGGLASGFLNRSNIDPTVGVRVRF